MMLAMKNALVIPPRQNRRRQTGKFVIGQLIWQAALFALVCTTSVRAGDASADAVAQKDIQAKVAYCEVCHGVSAQGFRGYYPIPRLAGQQVEYLQNQLQAFIERRRTNNIMFNVGHVLSPAMVAALTANFHDLNPKPLGGAPKDLVDTGKTIFVEGITSANIPPCTSCHGPDAKGNGAFPRLAGQLYEYVTAKLTNWDKERGQNPDKPDTSAIMEPIAHGLNPAQIKAVAAYVSYLE